MMTAGSAALLAAACPPPAGAAYKPVGFPGSTWGSLGRDMSGFEGYGAQAWVQQGVEWFRLPYGVKPKTFGAYRWRARTENGKYYDCNGPAVTVELTKSFVDVGVDFAWQRFPGLQRNDDRYEIYAAWYKSVDLSSRTSAGRSLGLGVAGLPLTFWGRLSHDINGFEGDGAQGWVKQGMEWLTLPAGFVVKAQAAYQWRLRSQERLYYNVHGPALGVELSRPGIDIGVEHVWRNYPDLRRDERTFQLYANWYYAWDFSRL